MVAVIASTTNRVGYKNSQLPEQQTDVVTGTTQHRMQYITQRALERVSGQSAIHLHMSNGRFNGASQLDHRFEGWRDAPSLA